MTTLNYTINTNKILDLTSDIIRVIYINDANAYAKYALQVINYLYDLAKITRKEKWSYERIYKTLKQYYISISNDTDYIDLLSDYILNNNYIIINRD